MRIINLLDEHKDTLSNCPGCSICSEIKQLRLQLERDPADKYKRILSLGPDMKKSDIAFLLENDVPTIVIWKALGLKQIEFWELMKSFGLTKRGKDYMAINITVNEFVQLHHVEGKTIGEISELKGLKKNALSNWKWLNKEKIQSAVQTSDFPVSTDIKPSKTKTTPKELDTKTEQYDQLIKALRNDLLDAHKQLDEKDELIRNLNLTIEKYQHIDAACDDVESEIASLHEELEHERKRNNELSKLENLLIRYQKENKALKDLLKIYL